MVDRRHLLHAAGAGAGSTAGSGWSGCRLKGITETCAADIRVKGVQDVRQMMALICGFHAVLLGGLWMLEGLGIVHLRPLLCYADCAPLQGPPVAWMVIGAVTLVADAFGFVWSRRNNPA